MAQYADACNLFGDTDALRHKLDVLERHCADVGRDPAEITRTVLYTVWDAKGGAEAIRRYREVGVDGVVVNMPEVADLDAVAVAGETIRPVLE